MTLLYCFTPHQGTTKQGTHTAPSCVHSLVLKVSTNWITSAFSTHQRGLIDTENKPFGRLCKMCNTFFHEFRVSPSANGFHFTLLYCYFVHKKCCRLEDWPWSASWLSSLWGSLCHLCAVKLEYRQCTVITVGVNRSIIREERWLYIWCCTQEYPSWLMKR
jgi:hypothetical protein